MRGRTADSVLTEHHTQGSARGLCKSISQLERIAGSVSSYFFMSDDPRSFQSVVYNAVAACFRNSSVVRTQSDVISEGTAQKLNAEALDAGHETWPNRRRLYFDALSEAFAVSRYANYIVG